MSSSLYLLDTSVLLHTLRGKEQGKILEERFKLISNPQKPLISVVSIGEIRVIAATNKWGSEKLKAIERMISNVVVVPIFHQRVLDAYVDISMYLRSHETGAKVPGQNDLWIAACASATAAHLLTTDEDFSYMIPGRISGTVVTFNL